MSSPSSPPSSRPPAGVPGTSNAKYALVAVLLIAGAAGLFAFRTCSSPPPAPVPIPSASVAQTAAPSNPKLDDIPLPPPPEEKPEAGPPPKIVYVPVGGCDSKCNGTAPPELEQMLQIRGAQARRCYNQALSQDSSLKGKVTIAVKVGPAGNLCSANVAANDMGSPAVANCAVNIFRNGGYPAPKNGCVEATVPPSFIPQGQ
jgi:hypothetical protein